MNVFWNSVPASVSYRNIKSPRSYPVGALPEMEQIVLYYTGKESKLNYL